ncbi:MAG: hypothetical protein V4498_02615 [candidate division FCPU426 bacterium]
MAVADDIKALERRFIERERAWMRKELHPSQWPYWAVEREEVTTTKKEA